MTGINLKFIYKKARQECKGKPDIWVKAGINEILRTLEAQMNKTGKAPESEQIDRIETVLRAMTDELNERGIKG